MKGTRLPNFKSNLPSASSDALRDDSTDEEVPANNLLEFSSDSEEDAQEIEQDSGCGNSCLENTVSPAPGCSALKKHSIEISLKMDNV
ncbi:hypothetical protein TNCV_1024001 [Trichonephila clavipes]|nr:hypothetical protein TNCV_1024001 [Trichonephila clavipes]